MIDNQIIIKIMKYLLSIYFCLSLAWSFAQNIEKRTAKQLKLSVKDNVLEGQVIFESEETIETSQTIAERAEVSQQARQSITLTEGFHAREGSVFLATIVEVQKKDNPITKSEVIDNQVDINIYPNPTDGAFKIDLPTQHEKTDWVIQILNGQGKEILKQKTDSQASMEVDLRQYPAGMYIIRLIDQKQKIITRKIIIE
jgi:hypothetical protein